MHILVSCAYVTGDRVLAAPISCSYIQHHPTPPEPFHPHDYHTHLLDSCPVAGLKHFRDEVVIKSGRESGVEP